MEDEATRSSTNAVASRKKRRRDDIIYSDNDEEDIWMNDFVSPPNNGHIMYDLLKSFDTSLSRKYSVSDLRNRLEKVVVQLRCLVLSCERAGMLQGNLELAHSILLSSGNSTDAGGSMKKMRKNRRISGRDNKGNDGLNEKSTDVGSNTQNRLDPTKIILSVLHILESNSYLIVDKKIPETSVRKLDTYRLMILGLAADLCTACSEFVKTQHGGISEIIVCAEYEILAVSGKSLLTALETRIREISTPKESPELIGESLTLKIKRNIVAMLDQSRGYVMFAYLRASASLVSLFRTKLSRSGGLVLRLREVAWENLLTVADHRRNDKHSIVKASAVLLSTLPLTGCVDGQSCSQGWNQTFSKCIFLLFNTVELVNPFASQENQVKSESSLVYSNAKEQTDFGYIEKWIAYLRLYRLNSSVDSNTKRWSESELIIKYVQGVEGLTELAGSLLASDHVSPRFSIWHQDPHFEVDLVAVIGLIESMLKIDVQSEASSAMTPKKRSRVSTILPFSDEVLSGIFHRIKANGLKLFLRFLISIGNEALLPYSARLSALAYNTLLTSASLAVQFFVDPTRRNHGKHRQRKREKQLSNTSLVSRRMAIDICREIVTLFGTNVRTIKSEDNLFENELHRTVTIVCCNIVEQLSIPDSLDDCGTIGERINLASTCFFFLEACLVSIGEFLTMTSRSLIDSILNTYLLCIHSGSGHPVLLACAVKTSVITAGIACVHTPWQDGSSSGITKALRKSAKRCLNDRDNVVSSAAKRAIGICNSLASPCSPAIYIRRHESSRSSESIGFESLIATDTIRGELRLISQELSVRTSQEHTVAKAEQMQTELDLNESSPGIQVPVETLSFSHNTNKMESNQELIGNQQLNEHGASASKPTHKGLEFDPNSGGASEPETSVIVDYVLDKEKEAIVPISPSRQYIEDDDDGDEFIPSIVNCDPDDADDLP